MGRILSYTHARETEARGQTSLSATAKLDPTQGHAVRGTVTFTQVEQGVRVVANISGLTEGQHGFHIHENGDCSAPDASSAGGHFNPAGTSHGGPETAPRHLGDLGNIAADDTGSVHLDRVFPFLKLEGTNSIIGRGLIVHAKRDDLSTQPSGEAGVRVACGIISRNP